MATHNRYYEGLNAPSDKTLAWRKTPTGIWFVWDSAENDWVMGNVSVDLDTAELVTE